MTSTLKRYSHQIERYCDQTLSAASQAGLPMPLVEEVEGRVQLALVGLRVALGALDESLVILGEPEKLTQLRLLGD